MTQLQALLIGDWKKFIRFWSVRIQAVSIFLTGWMTIAPDTLLNTWNMMPGQVQELLPHNVLSIVGGTLFVLSMASLAARGLKQPKLED